MTTLKIILMQVLTGFYHMVQDHPGFAFGSIYRYLYWGPIQIMITVVLLTGILYFSIFKFKWSRRRYLIAYMRFFTGKKKMIEVVESSYTVVFAIYAGLLYHPYFLMHRAFLSKARRIRQYDSYIVRYVNTLLKKKIKNKKKRDTFWKLIAQNMHDFWINLPEETRDDIEFYSRESGGSRVDALFAAWDYADESYFVSNSEFHNLLYSHFYLFSENYVKSQLRGAIYDLFSAKDLLKDSADLDQLVDGFVEHYLHSYIPSGSWWHLASRNASTFASDVAYSKDILSLYDRLPLLFQLKTEYLFFWGHSLENDYHGPVVTDLEDVPPFTKTIKFMSKSFNKVNKWWLKNYKIAIMGESEEFDDEVTRTRWDDLFSMEEYNRLLNLKMVNWLRLEQYWHKKRARLFRTLVYMNYFPLGTDLSYFSPLGPEFKNEYAGTQEIHRYTLLPADLLCIQKAFTPGGAWTWKIRKATPKWYRYKWKKWNPETKKMKIWNSEGQDLSNYWRIMQTWFIRYHRKNTYGFSYMATDEDIGRWDKFRLIVPIERARDFYLLLNFKFFEEMLDLPIEYDNPDERFLRDDDGNIQLDEEGKPKIDDDYGYLLDEEGKPQLDEDEEPLLDPERSDYDETEISWLLPNDSFFSDGYGPIYSAFNYYFGFAYYMDEMVLADPSDVFDDWAPMSDSTFAHNITRFDPNLPLDDTIALHSDPVMERHYSNSVFDFAKKQQLGFQDPATPSMEGIIDLHHDLMFFLTIIVIFVLWLLISVVYYFYLIDENANEYEDVTIISSLKSHNVVLEIVWTVVPSLILLLIALPSFALIYSMDELLSPSITLKVIGHQWYWSYEYNHPLPAPGIQNVLKPTDLDPTCSVEKIFDSNMVLEEDLLPGQLRLLEVNNRTYLPTDVNIRVLITSADVLHSWAIPSLGIKVDACPGRLNQSPLFIKRAGVFYGQCSEICGVNHAFMPIVVHAVNPIEYLTWFHKAYTIKEI